MSSELLAVPHARQRAARCRFTIFAQARVNDERRCVGPRCGGAQFGILVGIHGEMPRRIQCEAGACQAMRFAIVVAVREPGGEYSEIG